MSVVGAENPAAAEAAGLASRVFSLEPDALDEPWPAYAALRRHLPVHRWGAMVVVATYDAVRSVLRDPETFSSVRMSGSRVTELRSTLSPEQEAKLDAVLGNENYWLVQVDDPEHARLLKFVKSTFSRPRIEAMRARIKEICDQILDEAETASRSGQMEFIHDFAYRLPLLVVCDLLGVELDDSDKIRSWSDQIMISVGTNYRNLDAVHHAVTNFEEFVKGLIERTRNAPGVRTDLFAELVSATADGEVLSDRELVSMFTLLLFAGHETTTNLIANSVIELLRHPDQRELLTHGGDIWRTAVDELMRFCTSTHAIHRVATRDTEILGFPVKEGETIRLVLASANRDDAHFQDPDRLDLTRDDARKQIGFGYGIHTCLGIWLARLETEIALETVFRRYPNLAIAAPYDWIPAYTLHGVKKLELTY